MFTKRSFADEVIITCVRVYLRFRLSYRDLSSIAAELKTAVSPSTIMRWVVQYTGGFVRCWSHFELVTGSWMFLYRAVGANGRTVASYLSRTRDQTEARIFFRKALKRHGEPRSITLDGFEPSHCALRRIGMRNEFNFFGANPMKIRSAEVSEQHGRAGSPAVKFRLSAMLGFKSFENARIVLAGIELIQKLKKGQYGVPRRLGQFSRDIWNSVLTA